MSRSATFLLPGIIAICCCFNRIAYKIDQNTDRAKQWLQVSIKQFLKDPTSKTTSTVIFTKRYLEYKQDAISRDFDGMTDEQFKKKWQRIYNTKFANRNSLLLGQQDEINPRLTHLELKNKNPDNSFIFNVILEDADTHQKFIHHRDVKIIQDGKTFKIDDVLEYDN